MRYAVFAILLGAALARASGPQADQRLAAERAKIDAVDRRVVALLNERAILVRDIGRIKQQSGAAVNDPTRVADVLRRVTGANRGPLPNEHLQRIYAVIVREMTAFEAQEMSRP
jgi:chorismate mutase/prephenate dehydratase